MKKKGYGSGYKILSKENTMVMRSFDNNPVNLISLHVAVDPIGNVRRFDQREKLILKYYDLIL